ncbi:MAG: hypothetical protein OXC13_18910 [Caldilineaceae bacterium]|nr:hypothetical protein [Caldilineaceae bacterium]
MDAKLTELTPKQSMRLFAIALVLLTTHHKLPHQATIEELLVGGHEALGLSPHTWAKVEVAKDTSSAVKILVTELIQRMPLSEREERKSEAILIGGEFAEAGECGRDDLPCGVCDVCIGDAVAYELNRLYQQWKRNQPRPAAVVSG